LNNHVDFVGVLFLICGLLTTLIGVSMLALGVGAVALIMSQASSGGQFAAGLTAAALTTLALIAIAWGVAHIVAGLALRRLRHWSRMAALVLGSVDLVLLPYGTALGAYALWTLLSEGGKALFLVPHPARDPHAG
jgi:hypothetical protein